MTLPLDERQRRVAERIRDEEGSRRRHLVLSLSGSHAYGFPSPDSDLDLKAIHVEPTAHLLGLQQPKETHNRLEVVDGVEIDYTSNELALVLRGILQGNGNFIERVVGPLRVSAEPELEGLAELVRGSLSKRMHNHYRGFAISQLREVEKNPAPMAKKVLYVLRTALTGTHALRTGRVVADLTELASEYGFADAQRLVEAKRAGERAPLSPEERERWLGRLGAVLELLDQAQRDSTLPAEPPNAAALEDWLVALRRRAL